MAGDPNVDLSTLQNNGQQILQQTQAGQNALAEQKLQQQSQQNVLATQVLSAASSTGNQGLYDSAKMHLSSGGIDTSMWPQDVGSGQTFAQSARLAQSPLGPMVNAANQADRNQIMADTAAGRTSESQKNHHHRPHRPCLRVGYPEMPGGRL